jgi:ComF family protein
MCSDCKKTSFNFKKNISLIRYDELAKAIFHEIKHKRRKRVLNIFNPYLESLIKQITIPLDSLIMTCVPLDPKRHRERTFNQSHIIATRLSRTSGIAYHKSILQRKRSKHPQSLLGRKERLTNVQGLFKLKNSHLVKNKDIILVDDILTTGSTVNECARVLLDGNAHSVTVITIARA